MLDYEWGNPSAVMLSGDGNGQESDQNRQIFDPYAAAAAEQGYTGAATANFVNNNHNNDAYHFSTTHHLFHNPNGQEEANNTHFSSLYDPRVYNGASSAASYGGHNHHLTQASLLSLEPAGPTGYMVIPKSEPVGGSMDFASGSGHASRIGLNLGGRTYFSSTDDDFVNRLYRRSRTVDAGLINSPRCQAEGCNADLTHAKHYHRRHKVCEFHSKAATVVASGLTQRFCQQCSRFHTLSEFDNGKRSCRKRLADHNRRRRKSQQPANQQQPQSANSKSQLDNALNNSPSDNLARSPTDSGVQTSSVTVAVSPPRISLLNCFSRHRSSPYQQQRQAAITNSSSSSAASTSSLFFSNG